MQAAAAPGRRLLPATRCEQDSVLPMYTGVVLTIRTTPHSISPIAAVCVALGLAACGRGSGSQCTEAMPTSSRCCDPGTFELATIPDLVSNPGKFAGRQLEVVGTADWYQDAFTSPDCGCADNLCACTRSLALRSATCNEMIRIDGAYLNTPVQCGDTGCWPLIVLSRYAVCGAWGVAPPTSATTAPGLSLGAFCTR